MAESRLRRQAGGLRVEPLSPRHFCSRFPYPAEVPTTAHLNNYHASKLCLGNSRPQHSVEPEAGKHQRNTPRNI